jgi:hypothetical protein
MVMSACRKRKGGGGGGGPTGDGPGQEPPVIVPTVEILFTTPQQAGGQLAAALNTKALADAQFAVAVALGLGSRPAGFAPGLADGDIARLDPALKMMVDRMTALSRSPVIQKAASKAVALRAMRANTVNETLTVGFCDNADGNIHITGTNNYDDTAATLATSSYTITFTDCRDDILFTELEGQLTVEQSENIENLAAPLLNSKLTANLSESRFSDATFAVMTEDAHLSGTFTDNDEVASGSMNADGFFTLTTPAAGTTPEALVNYTFIGLKADRASTSDAVSTTDTNITNGTFTVGRFTGEVEVFKMTLALTDLEDRVHTATGPQGDPAVDTKKQSIKGTIGMAWAPEVSGCLSGLMTIATTTERTIAPADTCPSAGEMTINNAIIKFGSQIDVSLTNSTVTGSYATCAEMDQAGAACM